MQYINIMSFIDVLKPPAKQWATLYVNNVITPSGQLGAGFTGPTGGNGSNGSTGPTGIGPTGATGPGLTNSGVTGNSTWGGPFIAQALVPIKYQKVGKVVTLFVSEYSDLTLNNLGNFAVTTITPPLSGIYLPLIASNFLIPVVGGTGSTGPTGGVYSVGMFNADPSGNLQIFYTPSEDGFPLNGNKAGWKAFTVSYITAT